MCYNIPTLFRLSRLPAKTDGLAALPDTISSKSFTVIRYPRKSTTNNGFQTIKIKFLRKNK